MKRSTLALLVAAHNEELVIESTIRSALDAGMKAEHIYVVNDNSSDDTAKITRQIIPAKNVMTVKRSGKGLAIEKAAKKFKLSENYRWIHLADADGAFAPNYFRVFRKNLRVSNAAATGYIRSLPGRHVSQFRLFEYTLGMELHRRIQSMLGTIPVIPGPTSCFRSDVFDKVNFANESLTEDFDVTLQIYRQKLGKIQFISNAIAYTQDPRTLRDLIKQITRWNRGTMQSIVEHKIGLRPTRIDGYLSYQILQNILTIVNYFIWVPFLTLSRHLPEALAISFIFDVVVTFAITFAISARTNRWDVLSAFPYVFIVRWISLTIFMKSFIEVIVLRRFKVGKGGMWENHSARRYVVNPN